MSKQIARIAVAGTTSGVGKTTITMAIIAALTHRGLIVQPYKAGPDYIDPSYHSLAAQRPCRNIDTWLTSPSTARALFERACEGADLAVIEGVMGLFDGRPSLSEPASTADVAKVIGSPVLLVIDGAKTAQSAAAMVLGYASYDPALRIVGVILNNVAGEGHFELARQPIEARTGIPVLGWFPKDDRLRLAERHLGLIPALERTDARVSEVIAYAAALAEQHLDLERLLQAARAAPARASSGDQTVFPEETRPPRARIGIARDNAFGFYYEDNLDLLRAWGAELVPFSPLDDVRVPDRLGCIYIGGGFPEVFAEQLAANASMLKSIKHFGKPIYAECGGLMYLSESLTDMNGRRHTMTGLVPAASEMQAQRVTIGYVECKVQKRHLLAPAGSLLRGHEFHWSRLDRAVPAETAAYQLTRHGDSRLEGFAFDKILASYVHLHFAGDPGVAPRMVDLAAAGA